MQYSNTNGFAPEYWGPGLWRAIHLAAATYPLRPTHTDKSAMHDFLKSLKHVLPCGGCRQEYTRLISSGILKLTPQVLNSRLTLFAWTVDVHNAVSRRLGKPVRKTWQQWFAHYDRLR